jgi:hypothetical protein
MAVWIVLLPITHPVAGKIMYAACGNLNLSGVTKRHERK